MKLSIIVAMDKNRLIGSGGMLPWHIPEDLAWFKSQTLGHPVIMGKNTWQSLAKPLPDRQNIVLSRDPYFNPMGAQKAASLEEAISLCQSKDGFVIGGARIFEQFLPLVYRLVITHIDAEFGGDTYFPFLDLSAWQLLSSEELHTKDGIKLCFAVYSRKPA